MMLLGTKPSSLQGLLAVLWTGAAGDYGSPDRRGLTEKAERQRETFLGCCLHIHYHLLWQTLMLSYV